MGGAKSGFIYKVRYEGKTMYPCITADGRLKTVLCEGQVNKNLRDRKNGKKHRPRGKTSRRS